MAGEDARPHVRFAAAPTVVEFPVATEMKPTPSTPKRRILQAKPTAEKTPAPSAPFASTSASPPARSIFAAPSGDDPVFHMTSSCSSVGFAGLDPSIGSSAVPGLMDVQSSLDHLA